MACLWYVYDDKRWRNKIRKQNQYQRATCAPPSRYVVRVRVPRGLTPPPLSSSVLIIRFPRGLSVNDPLLFKNEKIPHLSRFFFRFRKAILPEKTYPEIFFIFIISRLSFRSHYSKNFEFQDDSSSESWNTSLEQIYIITNSYRERVGIRIVFRVLLYHQVAEFFLRIFG